LERNGGWSFAFHPAEDPRSHPALWSPDQSPFILSLKIADGSLDTLPLSIDHLRPLSSCVSSPDRRHLVADTATGRHRLTLPANHPGDLALILPLDAALPVRLSAASRLAGAPQRGGRQHLPTSSQRRRLALLLALLDADSAGLSRHAIAERLLFRHMRPLHGAEWKGSAERRHTYRLWAEAIRLRDGGYRHLLHGRLHRTG
jgi:hypothetical protein